MSKDDDHDTAIAAYRAQLRAEAELADGDLDEIEDHLRLLADDLKRTGMPAAEAVTEAARRLGEPRTLAREHSRVRSAFGSRLSPLRAWSVAALLVPMLVYSVVQWYPQVGLWNRFTLEILLEAVLVGALLVRMGWARPILLAGAIFGLCMTGLFAYVMPDGTPLYIVWNLGLVAFLMPWRRNELTGAGYGLLAYAWTYATASWTLSFQLTGPDGSVEYFASAGVIACLAAAAATAGAVLRARWSSAAGVVAAVMLGVAGYQLLGVDFRFDHPTVMQLAIMGSVVTGLVAALAGSALAWRGARSTFGSVRAIRS